MKLVRLSAVLGSACVVWLVGCGEAPRHEQELDDGQSHIDPGTENASPTDGGPSPDAGPPSDAVLVTNTTRFYTSVGIAEQVNDLSAHPPEILVQQGSTFQIILGSAVPGGWRFNNVPSGPYYLRTGSTQVITDARHIDIGSNRLGRMDAEYSNSYLTALQINLLNLAPWQNTWSSLQPGSSLQLTSGEVDLFGYVNIFDQIPDGQTTLLTNQADLGLSSGYNLPIFDASKGDRMYVNQLSQFSAGTAPDGTALGYAAVERSVQMGAFDYVPDGITPLAVSGYLQPTPMREFPIEWRLPVYTQFATDVHPQATGSTPLFEVLPNAHNTGGRWVGYSGELLNLFLPRSASFNFTSRLKFGNPFPSSWGLVGIHSYPFRVLSPVPDDSGISMYLSGRLYSYDVFDNLIAGPVQPRVSPPRALTIDGVPASVQREVGTNSPVLAWTPPTLGTPHAYRVSIYRYDSELRFLRPAGSIYAPGSTTQLRLPPGTLQPDSIYYLRVASIVSPGFDLSEPFTSLEKLPFHSAEAISSFFTTP
ncbi:hypothetical protein LXT21_40285 [Myxococcus sp. K38C18041901]|uniref:hypothetical protein n=1 Tax=Myxococcus guangdongensis TaxID=2906760 RepID=UPI0020A6FD3C|nr:hypothetical protein [Myxococcus guangdongensis]MCP3065032.1 hypothetical protein [Myxococcus guangdongensis]